MSAVMTETAGHYRIEVTAEQLEGLKTALSYAQVALKADIRESEKSAAFWAEKGGTAEQSALAQANMATFRGFLAGAEAAAPAVFGAKFVPTRRRRR